MKSANRFAMLTGLVALLSVMFMASYGKMPSAYAATNLLCIDTNTGVDVQDEAPIQLGTPVHCDSSTTNSKVINHRVIVIDGSGTTIQDTGIVAGKTASADFTTDNQGVWEITVDYYDAAGTRLSRELINISISFFVIPESAMGAAGLIGSSFAALGAFMFLKRKSAATPMTSRLGA